MKKQTNLVPKRRFKEFQNTSTWEQRKLGNHAEILTGGTPNTQIKEYWEPKEIPWMSSGEINKKRLSSTDNMISKQGFKKSSTRWVKENSVLIALAGQGKTRGTVAINEIPLTTNQSIAAIVPNDELYYEFIFQNLEKRYEELRLISSGGGTRGGLNKQLVSDVEIMSPSIEEQIKIGNFLNQLDNLISLQQRKLEKTKALKSAYLSEMFPAEGERVPKRRFAGFTQPWEQRKLGEIAGQTYGGGTPRTSVKEYWDGSIPWIQSSDLTEGKVSGVIPNKSITEEGLKNSATKLVPRNSIAIITRVGVGKLAFMPFQYTTSQDFLSLSNLKTNPWFTAYASYKKLQSVLNSVQGTSIKGITKEELLSKSIFIPCNKEQAKIGEFFKQLDNLITLHQRKLEKLQNLKKAYLNEMFV
ncbi:restriction endonuclease subunit S [Heyndrickxia coagulans]|uniref:restriction endonuclease subunit S n=1 Tax=Heyndrickxia coagulans TaxID=1398 RepID=UPI003D1FC2EF